MVVNSPEHDAADDLFRLGHKALLANRAALALYCVSTEIGEGAVVYKGAKEAAHELSRFVDPSTT